LKKKRKKKNFFKRAEKKIKKKTPIHKREGEDEQNSVWKKNVKKETSSNERKKT